MFISGQFSDLFREECYRGHELLSNPHCAGHDAGASVGFDGFVEAFKAFEHLLTVDVAQYLFDRAGVDLPVLVDLLNQQLNHHRGGTRPVGGAGFLFDLQPLALGCKHHGFGDSHVRFAQNAHGLVVVWSGS